MKCFCLFIFLPDFLDILLSLSLAEHWSSDVPLSHSLSGHCLHQPRQRCVCLPACQRLCRSQHCEGDRAAGETPPCSDFVTVVLIWHNKRLCSSSTHTIPSSGCGPRVSLSLLQLHGERDQLPPQAFPRWDGQGKVLGSLRHHYQ